MKVKYLILFLLTLFSFSCVAQKNLSINNQVDGKWSIQLNSNDIGTIHTIFHFNTNKSSFEAWTRKGALKDIFGFWKATLAKVFTDDFKKGSLIRITDGNISRQQDTLILRAIFRSTLGNYYFNGKIFDGHLKAILKNSKQETKGKIRGKKNPNISYPLNNYPKIISEVLDTSKSKIYNRRELRTKDWHTFEKHIKRKSERVQDDIEIVFAFYYYASKLPFSHFYFTRIQEDSTADSNFIKKHHLFLERLNSSTALLTIKSFGGSAAEVDSIFAEIINKGYSHLIVDLRNNSGGTVEAGLTFASKVIDTTMLGGFFLTQKWFNHNNEIPKKKQLDKLSVFSKANHDLIIEGIHQKKGLLLKVEPSVSNYDGRLYIITNSRTASTCEPIVYSLKNNNRATIIGEATASAMLNGERFDLQSGFSVIVPTADYYAIDGFKIDQNGVKPDISVKGKDPIQYILKQLIK